MMPAGAFPPGRHAHQNFSSGGGGAASPPPGVRLSKLLLHSPLIQLDAAGLVMGDHAGEQNHQRTMMSWMITNGTAPNRSGPW